MYEPANERPGAASFCRQTRRTAAPAVRDWVMGVANMLLVLGVFVAAIVRPGQHARASDPRCVLQIGHEEGLALEAFFADPSGEDALARAEKRCLR
jgi:hypothetical protein